jgi:RimJ/RimL family protein N-acetyltransferase
MTPTSAAAARAAGVTAYELRLAGHLDDHWSGTLGDLALIRCPDGTTTLTGPVADQAKLHGVLARVRDLGVPLLSLRAITSEIPGDADEANSAVPPALAHPLRTDRLTLRSGTLDDAYATWGYRRLEALGEWLTEIPTDLGAYRSTFAEPYRLAATVIVEHDGQVIGDFMLRVEDGWAQAEVADQARATQAELGCVLDPAHTGHGYATEAARALLDHCFTTLRVRRVIASCFVANDSSCRLMERLGMRREGLAIAESLHRSGQWLDTATYAVLATERRHWSNRTVPTPSR